MAPAPIASIISVGRMTTSAHRYFSRRSCVCRRGSINRESKAGAACSISCKINLGRNETWDTHGNAFPHLKNDLLPPMDRCVSALLDDLDARGLLDTTMIVMAGEFGRTPRISHLPQHYALPGRDHWGAVQTVFF